MQYKSSHKLASIVILFFALLFTTKVQAQRIYVDSASTTGTNKGTSWANAYTNFAIAVTAAVAGDTIWVAKGTYKPILNGTFVMKTGVAIYGGFAGTETTLAARNWTTNNTILKGNGNNVIFNSTVTSAILDGFTVTGGNGPDGGGMSNNSSSPTITNVIFSGNTTSTQGGGINNITSSPIITNVTFSNNTASISGGGMYNHSSSPIITNVTFAGNKATSDGGGIDNFESSPTITNVTFAGNKASNGGGMYNSASSPEIINVTFSNDTARTSGGGIYNTDASTLPTITNCVFWGNIATTSGNDILNAASAVPVVTYCYMQTATTGTGNTTGTIDPFANDASPAGADGIFMTADDGLELVGTSAAVNTGRNTAIPSGITTDITGAKRIIGSTVDMGAYEYLNRLYVDSASTGGLNNGSSWANAYTRFDTAVNKAVAGDTIWVAKGTYQPALNASFTMKTGVAIYGGFAGTEITLAARNWITNSTILKGNNNTVIINSSITSSAILDGFTVTGGKGATGGGMSNTSSSPTITSVTFSGNTAINAGGGMYNNSSSPIITNVTFSGNTVINGGGGMYNNSSSPTITNVIFSENTATGSGGGMYNFTNSSPAITNVTFSRNTAFTGGGMNNGNSSPTITNSIFSGNTATSGGGISNNSSSPIITNSIFSGNTAQGGGGMSNSASFPTITNVTFSGNTSTRDGGGGISNSNVTSLPATLDSITNCVFWGNTTTTVGNDIFNDIGATAIVTYCYTQTATAGTGNITGTIDPFVNDTNPAGADSIFGTADDGLQLIGCSSTVNTGINTANTTLTDITGQPRVFNTTIDMGAFEYQSNPDGTSLAIAGDTTAQTIYPGTEALIADSSCRIIAKLLPNGGSPLADTVKAKVYIDASVQNYLGQPYVQRHYDITPSTNASTSTATVTLFFKQAEFDSLNNHSSVKLPTGPSDNAGIANINIIQFHGTSATGTPGTYSGATVTIVPNIANIIWNNTFSRWEISFPVNGFSGFIVAPFGGTVLSLDLLSFTGQLVNGKSQLQWQTANEVNTDYFEVDKSTDGKHFDSLTTVKAIGSGDNSYATVDAYPQTGTNYYRLKLVNKDGSFTYSNIVSIQVGSNGNTPFVVCPNPTSRQLIVNYVAANNAIISIYNLTGQKVLSIPTNGQPKTTIDVSNLANGTYLLQYNSDTETLVSKFIKVD